MGKNSFLIYHDYAEHFKLLSDAELGTLLRGIMTYETEGMEPEFTGAVNMAFSFIRSQLVRDRNEWEKKAKTSRDNGSLGGRPKNPENPAGYSKTEDNPDEPKKPVTVTVTDTVTDIDIPQEREAPPKSPRKTKTPKPRVDAPTDERFSPAVNQCIADWLEYKDARKEKYADIGLRKLMTVFEKQIAAHGEQAVIDVVDYTISNQWQGIVWDKAHTMSTRSRDAPPAIESDPYRDCNNEIL